MKMSELKKGAAQARNRMNDSIDQLAKNAMNDSETYMQAIDKVKLKALNSKGGEYCINAVY